MNPIVFLAYVEAGLIIVPIMAIFFMIRIYYANLATDNQITELIQNILKLFPDWHTGKIDGVQMFNRALSSKEVAELHNQEDEIKGAVPNRVLSEEELRAITQDPYKCFIDGKKSQVGTEISEGEYHQIVITKN